MIKQEDLAEAFTSAWDKGEETFKLLSSGSTGEPKEIILERKWMEWSAGNTAGFIKPRPTDKMLICLPLSRVGGLMMLVRAKIWQIPYSLTEVSANPLSSDKGPLSIISLTPYQLYHVMSDSESMKRLLQFREVLIGGAEIHYQLEERIKALSQDHCRFRQSYGMTETYSHIALRDINGPHKTDYFTAFKDVSFEKDEGDCLIIHAPFVREALKTNDVVELIDNSRIVIKGRRDNVINSGGVKLQTEEIEKKIRELYAVESPFVISSIPDPVLGERLVLVAEAATEFRHLDWELLKNSLPYSVPKDVLEIKKLPVNEGAKYDRLLIRQMIRQ